MYARPLGSTATSFDHMNLSCTFCLHTSMQTICLEGATGTQPDRTPKQ